MADYGCSKSLLLKELSYDAPIYNPPLLISQVLQEAFPCVSPIRHSSPHHFIQDSTGWLMFSLTTPYPMAQLATSLPLVAGLTSDSCSVGFYPLHLGGWECSPIMQPQNAIFGAF